MKFKVYDKVTINDNDGNPIAKGVIININDFREPNMKYTVDIEGYDEYVFVSENNLMKIYE